MAGDLSITNLVRLQSTVSRLDSVCYGNLTILDRQLGRTRVQRAPVLKKIGCKKLRLVL